MVLLLDGDFLIYTIGFTKNEDKTDRDLTTSLSNLKFSFDNIMKETGCDSYLFYLTGKSSYRKDKVSTYKEQRVDAPKPLYYKELRDYCVEELNAEIVEHIEADDAVSIAAKKLGYDNVIICSKDKDVLQVPCKVFIPGNCHNNYESIRYDCRRNNLWVKEKSKTKELKGYGRVWFYAQMVIGDTVDNIPCLPSWEKERISKLDLAIKLLDLSKPEMWYKRVLGKFIDYYNTEQEPNKGLEVFMDRYLQLKLLEEECYGFTVKEPNRITEPNTVIRLTSEW